MTAIGQPLPRVDGPAKVTGIARFAGDFPVQDMAHGALVLSTIARGRITGMDTAAAERAPGVIAVLTPDNAPHLPFGEPEKKPIVDPKVGHPLRPLQDHSVWFNGQPIGVVVAETPEQAGWAAAQVTVSYAAEPHRTDLGAGLDEAFVPDADPEDYRRGEPERALGGTEIEAEGDFAIAAEHHNPIETHVTTARWQGDHLTVYDKTQWVSNVQRQLGLVFGIPQDSIHVICPYVGGGFGSGLRMWPHVVIAAMAARQIGRPVRVALSRAQLFTVVGHRPRNLHHVAIGATREGKLEVIRHDGYEETSSYEQYNSNLMLPTQTLYACPHVFTRHRLIRCDVTTPADMRAPGIVCGAFALESTLDILAEALDMDPVDVRLRNVPDIDPVSGKPYSSNALAECLRQGAERFGWQSGPPGARGRSEGPVMIGQGMAVASHPVWRAPASAWARVGPGSIIEVRTAASDMGPGTYTMLSQVAADALDVPPERIKVQIGNSDLPFAPVHGGSITTASVGSAVHDVCAALRQKILALPEAVGSNDVMALLDKAAEQGVEASVDSKPGRDARDYARMAYGAHFVEVRVDPALAEVRVSRAVGAYAAGRIVNPLLARSQVLGGITGGIGMALMERAEMDHRFGRVLNANLTEYVVPGCADTPEIEAVLVAEDDPHLNPVGAKGLAELTLVGVAAAIANALCDATGLRFTRLPITPDRIIDSLEVRGLE